MLALQEQDLCYGLAATQCSTRHKDRRAQLVNTCKSMLQTQIQMNEHGLVMHGHKCLSGLAAPMHKPTPNSCHSVDATRWPPNITAADQEQTSLLSAQTQYRAEC